MKPLKQNPYMMAGLLINASFLIMNQAVSGQDMLKGLLAGVSIGLLLLGFYYGKYDKMPFAKQKAAFFKKFTGR